MDRVREARAEAALRDLGRVLITDSQMLTWVCRPTSVIGGKAVMGELLDLLVHGLARSHELREPRLRGFVFAQRGFPYGLGRSTHSPQALSLP